MMNSTRRTLYIVYCTSYIYELYVTTMYKCTSYICTYRIIHLVLCAPYDIDTLQIHTSQSQISSVLFQVFVYRFIVSNAPFSGCH